MSSTAIQNLLAYTFPSTYDGISCSTMLTTVAPLLQAVLTDYSASGVLATDTSLTLKDASGNSMTTNQDPTELTSLQAVAAQEQTECFSAYNTFKTSLKNYIANI